MIDSYALLHMAKIKNVLVVCLGNICRSPMGEGILRDAIESAYLHVEVDSAGTQGYHAGEAPDPRAIRCMKEHGIDISQQSARKLMAADFEQFDLILTMDQQNFINAQNVAPNAILRQKVKPFLSSLPNAETQEVPDPYYGSRSDFEKVYELCSQAAQAWCKEWK